VGSLGPAVELGIRRRPRRLRDQFSSHQIDLLAGAAAVCRAFYSSGVRVCALLHFLCVFSLLHFFTYEYRQHSKNGGYQSRVTDITKISCSLLSIISIFKTSQYIHIPGFVFNAAKRGLDPVCAVHRKQSVNVASHLERSALWPKKTAARGHGDCTCRRNVRRTVGRCVRFERLRVYVGFGW